MRKNQTPSDSVSAYPALPTQYRGIRKDKRRAQYLDHRAAGSGGGSVCAEYEVAQLRRTQMPGLHPQHKAVGAQDPSEYAKLIWSESSGAGGRAENGGGGGRLRGQLLTFG